jgi:serine/threonine-protein kinase
VRRELLQRFQEEVRAAAGVDHEHIVPLYEAGETGGQPYYSMRYVDGGSLAELLQSGPLSGRRAAALLEPVAHAVHHLHTQDILHRDIKPRNLLVDRAGRLLVTDFGLAKRLQHLAAEATLSRPQLGTPAYMAPEQARGTGRIGPSCDVYSLGATLYEMLTGRPPFQAATPLETLRHVLDDDPPPPRRLCAAIDRDLETICLRCLRKEPARRYASAQALAEDLGHYSAGRPIRARPPSQCERVVTWGKRRPITTALLLLVVILMVGSWAA